MRHTKRILALVLGITMILTVFAGCAGNTAPQASTADGSTAPAADGSSTTASSGGGKTLRFSQTADPPTLDPQLMNSAPSQNIGAHIYEPLMRSHGGVSEPGAAESYDVSGDGLVYTFHLRDMNWSDGQPVTAGDFEYGIKRLVDPEVASLFSFIALGIKNADAVNSGSAPLDDLGVKALDDKTLEITLEFPQSYFIGMLQCANFAPTRKDMVEKYGVDFANTPEANVYCGPFVLQSWAKNDRLILAKNDQYWNKDVVKLDTVEILTVSDTNTVLAMFESGELDFAELSTELAALHPEADHYYSGANDYLKLNMKEGTPLANKNLRLALSYGISRNDYIKLATNDVYEANKRFVLPQVNGVKDEYAKEYPYEAFPLDGDKAKAQEYLAEALKELNIANPADLTLELLTTDTETSRVQAEVIQAQFESNLGIKINIRQVPYKQRLEMEPNHEFEMVFTGWMPDYSDPYSYLELWTTDSPYNHGFYNSADYDKYMADSITTTDPKARMDLLFEAEKTLLQDGAIICLQLRRIPYLTNPKLSGFTTYFVGLQYDFMLADMAD